MSAMTLKDLTNLTFLALAGFGGGFAAAALILHALP